MKTVSSKSVIGEITVKEVSPAVSFSVTDVKYKMLNKFSRSSFITMKPKLEFNAESIEKIIKNYTAHCKKMGVCEKLDLKNIFDDTVIYSETNGTLLPCNVRVILAKEPAEFDQKISGNYNFLMHTSIAECKTYINIEGEKFYVSAQVTLKSNASFVDIYITDKF